LINVTGPPLEIRFSGGGFVFKGILFLPPMVGKAGENGLFTEETVVYPRRLKNRGYWTKVQ
jgi:hypothetical protein